MEIPVYFGIFFGGFLLGLIAFMAWDNSGNKPVA